MAKRKLNKQQKYRISRRHSAICKEPSASGQEPSASGQEPSAFDQEEALGEERQGLVISHYRAQADVEYMSDGDIVRCHLRANLPAIVTGDRVTWRRSHKEASAGIVEAIHKRSSELCRPDSYGKMKLVAANITHAIIVMAPEPEPHANLIDRYLVVAEHLGINALLLWNKSDLKDSPAVTALKQSYAELGYESLDISSVTKQGMATLQNHIASGCSVFVGQSGVGKSSIIQALLPNEDIKIGDLSNAARKGRHTTTHARLYHFPTGGDCIDSPGIREFGLWHLTPEEVFQGFKEFRPFIGECKFRNCTHINDKHCALIAAASNKTISRERYQSFVTITQSLGQVAIQNNDKG